jgi:serine/threonine protein kinase
LRPTAVTEPAPRDSREHAALAAWLREAIGAAGGRQLGSGYQASVHLYASPVGDVVVKQPHAGHLLGPLWRHLLRREAEVYARLAGIPGIPRSFGLIDDRWLVLEYVAGPSLREHEPKIADRERLFGLLLDTLRAMHAAGIAHRDLKRKDNIIVGAGERPYLIDFGIALLRGASWLGRRWFEHSCQGDYNAWVKLKYGRRVEPEEVLEVLSAADAAIYKPLLLERAARAVRVPWQTITLRRPRQRWRQARAERRAADRSHDG